MDQQQLYIQGIKEKLICAQKSMQFNSKNYQKTIEIQKRHYTILKLGDKMKNHGNFVYKQAKQLILH